MTDKFVYRTGESPKVTLEVHGDLKVKGDDVDEVVVKADSADNLNIQQQDDDVNIRCLSGCSVRVPVGSTIHITQAYGASTLKGLEGDVEIETQHGNLTLRSVGAAEIGNVYGELDARHIEGSLTVDRVDGNMSVRDVEGSVRVNFVGGNLTLEDIEESITASAEGNISLRLDPVPDQEYALKARGNVQWTMPEDASAEVNIPNAARIGTNLPGVTGIPRAPFTFSVGDGEAKIDVEAYGNVIMNAPGERMDFDFDFDFEPPEINVDGIGASADAFADQVTRQIDAQMDQLERHLNTHLADVASRMNAAGMSPEQVERMQRRAREASEQAAQRAQERMRMAQERLERKMAAVQQRAEQRARQAEERARQAEQRGQRRERRTWSFGFSVPETPRPPVPPRPPVAPTMDDKVSDDERLTVLRMLQEKKISLEQAEKLLAALEGKDL